jgi:multidrug transporter EmrE-like cation transporter
LAIFKQIHWASIALGFSIIGLEAGFLLAYRAGWKISLAAGIANAIVAALLVVIGLVFYREQLTLQNIIGIALCLAGLLLIQL